MHCTVKLHLKTSSDHQMIVLFFRKSGLLNLLVMSEAEKIIVTSAHAQ